MFLRAKKYTITIVLFTIFCTGCTFKEQLPISSDVYLKDYKVRLPKGQEKLLASARTEGIHDHPPSFQQNIAFKETFGFSEYVIGPGDILKITDWKSSGPVNIPTIVRPDGKISYSFLEDIKISGLTPTEVDSLLTEKVKGFLKNPRIDVLVERYSSKRVSISGSVKNIQGRSKSGPGTYSITGKITLHDQLFEAGGFEDSADISRIKLKRGGKTYIVNLAEQIQSQVHDPSKDIILEGGDIIIVPQFKRLEKKKKDPNIIYVFGEVEKVGTHKLIGNVNILDVIAKAGGFKINARRDNVKIIRGTPEDPIVLKTNVKRLFKKNDLTQLLSIKDGDIVFVASSTLGKIDDFSKRIKEFLDLAEQPAIYRDLYTTGGIGRLDTGKPITGVSDGEGGGGAFGAPGTVDSVDLIIRGQNEN